MIAYCDAECTPNPLNWRLIGFISASVLAHLLLAYWLRAFVNAPPAADPAHTFSLSLQSADVPAPVAPSPRPEAQIRPRIATAHPRIIRPAAAPQREETASAAEQAPAPAVRVDDPFQDNTASTFSIGNELGRVRDQEGRHLAKSRSKTVDPFAPEPETQERARLSRSIDRATRPDCKTAHAGAGLLAVVPILIDTIRDKGCKW